MLSDLFLYSFTSFFVLVDPISSGLIFYGLTKGASTSERARIAFQATLIAALIITCFAFVGETLLASLGISMAALRVAGGILLFHTAFSMITQAPLPDKPDTHQSMDIVVYPMAIPLLAGPGTLTLTVLLASSTESVVDLAWVLVSALVVLVITCVACIFSGALKQVIGKKGDDVLSRLLGVILAALAVQFVANGVIELLPATL
jgi:multiple antibiotic resistance protein